MADPTRPADPATPPADPATPPPAEPPADPKPADKQPPWGDPENFTAEKAWELIQNLRAEKGDPAKQTELEGKVAELETQRQAQMDAIAKALGLKPDDSPPDPAKLAEQVIAEQGKTTAAEARAAEAERRLAVFMAAPAAEGNALALLDSASFLRDIAEIDPTDEAKVTEAITAAVEKNPLFKASNTPPMPPLNGGPRTPAPTRAGSLEEAIAARFSSTTR